MSLRKCAFTVWMAYIFLLPPPPSPLPKLPGFRATLRKLPLHTRPPAIVAHVILIIWSRAAILYPGTSSWKTRSCRIIGHPGWFSDAGSCGVTRRCDMMRCRRGGGNAGVEPVVRLGWSGNRLPGWLGEVTNPTRITTYTE